MFEWINELSTWLQSWLSTGAGLWGLFLSAFVSATLLPGSSEVVMTALVTAYPDIAWRAFWLALAGNLLGCLLTFGMGHAGRQGYERFQSVQHGVHNPHVQRLRRYGPPALLLSFVPLVGDALVLAAGWLKLPFWQSMAWVAAGKAARYLLLLAGLLGILSLA
ncbi:MAG: VTT domain-containing protein [Rubrivivax sp.]|nr:VTT domain-containing protein [Rubrivivax sp.]